GNKRALGVVITRKRAVHLDENFLGEVFGIVARSGKAVADVIYPAAIALDDFLPGGSVAGKTAPDQHRDHLDVFHLSSPENVIVIPSGRLLPARDLGEPRDASRFMRRDKRALGSQP